nr:putative coat protein [Raphanus sativus cryptic virus 1]
MANPNNNQELLNVLAPHVEIPPPPPQQIGVADAIPVVAAQQQQVIDQAANAAAAQVARFEAEHAQAQTRAATAKNYSTLICGPAAMIHPVKDQYPEVSTFTPNFSTSYQYLNLMDQSMISTKRWTDNCLGWAPPYSQIYIGILGYIQTMRAMNAAGLLEPNSEISRLLGNFMKVFPLKSLWIPGPLVSFFKSIACFKPSASEKHGMVSPTLPTRPGWSRNRRYRIVTDASSHLPNINIFISRLRSICAAASRNGATEDSFLRDIDGPQYLATLFAQPCSHTANEIANLISPGSNLSYSGDLRLWKLASARLSFVGPLALLDSAVTDVSDNWTAFLGFSERSDWFGSINAMMVKYCQFWKGSTTLYECSPASSAAGSVRCIATDTNIFTPPEWNAQQGTHTSFTHGDANQAGHYNMRHNAHLTFQATTSVHELPLAHYYSALTYNINLAESEAAMAATCRGTFWNIFPDAYTRSGIQIYPGIPALIARDYHSETRIESERQNA